jgi:hypothetical protein
VTHHTPLAPSEQEGTEYRISLGSHSELRVAPITLTRHRRWAALTLWAGTPLGRRQTIRVPVSRLEDVVTALRCVAAGADLWAPGSADR